MGDELFAARLGVLAVVVAATSFGCGNGPQNASRTVPATTLTSSPGQPSTDTGVDRDQSIEVPLAESFDSGSTYEGGGIEASYERPITLEEIVDLSDLAVRATVIRIHPSTLNTRSGNLEVTAEQLRSDDPEAFPSFEPRTLVDLDVVEVLGVRPVSRVTLSDPMTIDVKGGAVGVDLPVWLAEFLHLYDPRDRDVDTPVSATQEPLDNQATIGVLISQPMNLFWSEGTEVIVFLAAHHVVLATGSAQPESRPAVIITYDPAGAFTVNDGIAEPNRTATELEPFTVVELSSIAKRLNTASAAAVPMR
jgi:hypothetical protein